LDFPFPEIERIADVEKLLSASELKIPHPLASGASLVTVKLLPMYTNDEAQVLLPA
jgi:hypothetical protein